LVANPLWQTLSAVQNGNVYRVSDYWYRGGSYTLAVHQVIDDLFIHLAGVDPAEVSPNPYPVAETAS
jgi:ABC-type Fe3+-hydroxamate transport system substrate-binding protein